MRRRRASWGSAASWHGQERRGVSGALIVGMNPRSGGGGSMSGTASDAQPRRKVRGHGVRVRAARATTSARTVERA